MLSIATRLVITAAAMAGLAACNTTIQEQLGIGKRSPDEFQVVRRAPLVVPRDLDSLPPPRPGAPRPQEVSSSQAAREVLTGAPSSPQVNQSAGEEALLAAMPVEAAPSIRETLRQENAQLADVDERTYLFILSWQKRRIEEQRRQAEVINPVQESERLQQEGVVTTVRTGSTPLPVDSGSGS